MQKVCGMPEAKQQVTRLTYEPGTSQTHSVNLSKMFWCPANV